MAKITVKKSIKKDIKTAKTVKKAVQAVKVVKTKKSTVKKTVTKKNVTTENTQKPEIQSAHQNNLTIKVVNPEGKSIGTIELNKNLFGVEVNDNLMSQAVRVYLANQRFGGAQAKTRGEVEGSTRKIYRQKGTGKARHGSIRAPIFVGGGAVFGPRAHDYSLNLPQKMKSKALHSALSYQNKSGNVIVVDGLDDLAPKTKLMSKAFASIAGVSHILFIIESGKNTCAKAVRNLENVDIMPATSLNTYIVLSHEKLIFTKDAIKFLSNEANHK
jgi:large subunit ribosomal protein L4